jgi:hypothetical protein
MTQNSIQKSLIQVFLVDQKHPFLELIVRPVDVKTI